MFTILVYSLFTFLGCIAANIWQLALFRFLAGMGIGGEWTLGGVLVAEEWPEQRREVGAAYMHTGYYFGTFLAALLNYGLGTSYGWRAMFAVGGVPALLVAFIRYGVAEPARWKNETPRVPVRPARLPHVVFTQVPAPHAPEHRLSSDIDDRTVGRFRVRARRGY